MCSEFWIKMYFSLFFRELVPMADILWMRKSVETGNTGIARQGIYPIEKWVIQTFLNITRSMKRVLRCFWKITRSLKWLLGPICGKNRSGKMSAKAILMEDRLMEIPDWSTWGRFSQGYRRALHLLHPAMHPPLLVLLCWRKWMHREWKCLFSSPIAALSLRYLS